MNYLESATNCKMIFNATRHASNQILNGYISVQFTEIKSALVDWFAWPNIPEPNSPTHGISETPHTA
jgi:hypothetical protein